MLDKLRHGLYCQIRYMSSKQRLKFRQQKGSSNSMKNFDPSSLVLLTVPLATFALGVWQTQRRSWKLNLIDELEVSGKKLPEDLPATPQECMDAEYTKVRVRGTFDYSRTVLVGPRSVIKDGGDVHSSKGILGSHDSSGWWKVSAFNLSNRDESILVNRGWVPLQSQEGFDKDGPSGETEVLGILRKSERKNAYTPPISEEDEVIHTRNIPFLAHKLGTSPIYLDSCETFPGGPIGGQTRVTLPNDHFSYMVTWFSLSGITLYMWMKKFILKR